jgi:hypothetical protein
MSDEPENLMLRCLRRIEWIECRLDLSDAPA